MITFGEGNLRIPRFEKPVYIVAGGMTDFRKRYPEKSTEELVAEALSMAILGNELNVSIPDFKRMVNFCVYSQFADHFGDQLLAGARVHDALGFDPLGNIEVKTGGATGGHAVLAGAMAIASGYADVVPVIGWERMDEVPTKQGNSYIASAACKNFESELGWMYASYYALMAQRYLFENQVPRETLAKITVKNRRYACASPFSQNPMKLTEAEVLANDMVSDPLSFLECCVMSTGAAALVLADETTAYTLTDHPVRLTAICSGTHTLRTADRRPMEVLRLPHEPEDLYKDREWDWPGFSSFLAARMAAYLAYHMAGIHNPLEELDILETHDAFTISDIQTYEDIGLRPYGRGREFIESGEAYLGGKLPTNLSGGLLGTMHAVGATGIFQIIEIFWQLQNRWAKFHADPKIWERFGKTMPDDIENLQVRNAKRGAAISHAGTGSHVTMAILEKS
ncbi:MAG: thiolase domain-containing protein [Candidatus Poribacteria bacterium]|nr:thiolase domain-containing protein [Candidatus Poribacteria bacterium]